MMTTVSPTPAARTRSSTSLGPIFGTGTVASRSGAPNSARIMAFIVSARRMLLGAALRRDDRQQEKRPAAATAVEGHGATEHRGRTIVGIGVRHAARAPRAVVELLAELGELALVLVVLATARERHAPAGRHHDARGDDLDVALVDLAGGQRLYPVVGMVGPVGQAAFFVESPMGDTQPPVGDRRVRIGRSHARDLLAVRLEQPPDQG